jgi:hypothetical protein
MKKLVTPHHTDKDEDTHPKNDAMIHIERKIISKQHKNLTTGE